MRRNPERRTGSGRPPSGKARFNWRGKTVISSASPPGTGPVVARSWTGAGRFNAVTFPEPGGNGLPPGVGALLDASPRGRQGHIHLSLTRDGFWNFEEESSRLALLEPDVLTSLLRHFGTAVNARSFAAVVRRDERDALRSAVGGELLEYALGRGSFHLGETRGYFLSRHADRPLVERVRLHGLDALAVCVGRWPDPLRVVAGQRFPELFDAMPRSSDRDHKLERLVWFGLKKLLTKEVAPQWAPCFS